MNLSVNGRQIAETVNTHAARLGVVEVDLGEADPEKSAFTIRISSAGSGAGGGLSTALDALIITDTLRK